LAVLGILGKVLMYTLLAIVTGWLLYVFGMAVINTVCDCIRTGAGDVITWLQT